MYEMTEPAQQSYLMWLYSALGIKYTFFLPLSGLLAFVLTLLIVIRGRGVYAAAALFLIVPIPLLVGLFGALEGTMSSFAVISRSSVTPKPSEWAAGVSMALVTPYFGLLLMVPSYILALVSITVKSLIRAAADAEKPAGR